MKDYERRMLVEALQLAERRNDLRHQLQRELVSGFSESIGGALGGALAVLELIEHKLRALLSEGLPQGAEPDCPTCLQIGSGMGPTHQGSKNCKSGSIASGGTLAHCTCGICF